MNDDITTVAQARQRLTSSADGIEAVIVFLMGQHPGKDTLDAIEVLRQTERIIRKMHGFACIRGDQ